MGFLLVFFQNTAFLCCILACPAQNLRPKHWHFAFCVAECVRTIVGVGEGGWEEETRSRPESAFLVVPSHCKGQEWSHSVAFVCLVVCLSRLPTPFQMWFLVARRILRNFRFDFKKFFFGPKLFSTFLFLAFRSVSCLFEHFWDPGQKFWDIFSLLQVFCHFKVFMPCWAFFRFWPKLFCLEKAPRKTAPLPAGSTPSSKGQHNAIKQYRTVQKRASSSEAEQEVLAQNLYFSHLLCN